MVRLLFLAFCARRTELRSLAPIGPMVPIGPRVIFCNGYFNIKSVAAHTLVTTSEVHPPEAGGCKLDTHHIVASRVGVKVRRYSMAEDLDCDRCKQTVQTRDFFHSKILGELWYQIPAGRRPGVLTYLRTEKSSGDRLLSEGSQLVLLKSQYILLLMLPCRYTALFGYR